MWELDHKEGLAWKNWCFWIVVLKKSLESLLDSKEIKPVNSKENQPWILIARTDTEAESLILCYLMQRANSLEKTLMLGKIEAKACASRSGSVLWPVLFWEALVSLLTPSHPRRQLPIPWVAGRQWNEVESGRSMTQSQATGGASTHPWVLLLSCAPHPAFLCPTILLLPDLSLASFVTPAFLGLFLPKSCLFMYWLYM